MENPGWAGGNPSDAPGAEYGAEGAGNVEGAPDVNYMYAGGQTGHNGAGAGEGY
jgi:hypothetical protein